MKKNLPVLLVLIVLCVGISQAQNRSVFFTHESTDGQYLTVLNHPLLNYNPDAQVLITQNWNPNLESGVINANTPAVWYDGYNWTIYNENIAPMPSGTSFNVMAVLNDAATAYTHEAGESNISENYTLLSDPNLDGNVSAMCFATHNYGNNFGVYNPRPTGVWYDGTNWSVYNEDDSNYLIAAASNVMVPGTNMHTITWTSALDNMAEGYSYINHPELNLHPEAIIILEHNWGEFGLFNDDNLAVFYNVDLGQWAIYNQELSAIPAGMVFNIVFGYPQPANEECATALNIDNLFHTGPDPQTSTLFTNNGAVLNDGDPLSGNECFFGADNLDNTIWFSFVGDGLAYNILSNNCGEKLGPLYINNGDTQFAVYTGSCGALTPIACNDDSPDATSENLYAELDLQTEDGVTYYLLVDGYSTATGIPEDGHFCLQVTQTIVGVEENMAGSIQLFPNPAEDVLRIQATTTISAFTCVNSLGQVVHTSSNVGSTGTQIDVSAFAPGIYVAIVTCGHTQERVSFVKR